MSNYTPEAYKYHNVSSFVFASDVILFWDSPRDIEYVTSDGSNKYEFSKVKIFDIRSGQDISSSVNYPPDYDPGISTRTSDYKNYGEVASYRLQDIAIQIKCVEDTSFLGFSPPRDLYTFFGFGTTRTYANPGYPPRTVMKPISQPYERYQLQTWLLTSFGTNFNYNPKVEYSGAGEIWYWTRYQPLYTHGFVEYPLYLCFDFAGYGYYRIRVVGRATVCKFGSRYYLPTATDEYGFHLSESINRPDEF